MSYFKVMTMKKPVKNKDNNQTKIKAKKLSQRDLNDLMGVNRDTYKRNRGAIRRK